MSNPLEALRDRAIGRQIDLAPRIRVEPISSGHIQGVAKQIGGFYGAPDAAIKQGSCVTAYLTPREITVGDFVEYQNGGGPTIFIATDLNRLQQEIALRQQVIRAMNPQGIIGKDSTGHKLNAAAVTILESAERNKDVPFFDNDGQDSVVRKICEDKTQPNYDIVSLLLSFMQETCSRRSLAIDAKRLAEFYFNPNFDHYSLLTQIIDNAPVKMETQIDHAWRKLAA